MGIRNRPSWSSVTSMVLRDPVVMPVQCSSLGWFGEGGRVPRQGGMSLLAKVRVTFLVPILCYGSQVQGKVTGQDGGRRIL